MSRERAEAAWCQTRGVQGGGSGSASTEGGEEKDWTLEFKDRAKDWRRGA